MAQPVGFETVARQLKRFETSNQRKQLAQEMGRDGRDMMKYMYLPELQDMRDPLWAL